MLTHLKAGFFIYMNKCISCKSWKQWDDMPEYGACFLLAILKVGNSSIVPATKGVNDMTPNDLVFNTGKNFGCVHHDKNQQK